MLCDLGVLVEGLSDVQIQHLIETYRRCGYDCIALNVVVKGRLGKEHGILLDNLQEHCDAARSRAAGDAASSSSSSSTLVVPMRQSTPGMRVLRRLTVVLEEPSQCHSLVCRAGSGIAHHLLPRLFTLHC